MGVTKSSKGAVSPLDDNSVFIIRKHGSDRTPQRPNLSRQTSVKSYQSKTSRLTLDEDLEILRSANIIFLRQVKQEAEKLANVPNKYIIVNSCGEMMFYALEVTDEITRASHNQDQPFKFAVVNTQGEEVFDIDGHPGVNGIGAYVTVKRDNAVLGNVAQINTLSSWCRKIPPCYLIESADGRTLQKIRRVDTWKNMIMGCLSSVNDFNVYSPDGTICKAKISRQTNAISLEEYSEADTYALSFHTTDIDGKLKALLLAALLMLDFQEVKTKAPRDYKSLINRALLCIFFILLLIGGIAIVWSTAVDFQKERETRFPGKIPT